MTEQDADPAAGWDQVTTGLQRARHASGDPSYTEITRGVLDLRLGRGATPHEARVPRSTVYDCFRPGRTRINTPLVRDIAAYLGVAEAEVEEWIARRDRSAEPVAPTTPPDPDVPPAGPPSGVLVVAVLAGCLVLNLLGRVFVESLGLPLHLDMVGTAVAAIALGPWRGAAVGVATNLLGVALSGPISLPFALVNVTGALIWGYGVHRWDLGRTLPRFLGLTAVVAVACSLVASLLLAAPVDLGPTAGRDVLLDDLDVRAELAWPALSNLLVSLSDKAISGFVALAVVAALPAAVRGPLAGLLAGVGRDSPR